MNNNINKVNAYIQIITDHVVYPIEKTDLKESCTATIMLVFAAIDGLGKLTMPDAKEKSASRKQFIYYLSTYMGENYKQYGDELYKLRCSLAHNAMNFTSFMSKTERGEQYHLQYHSMLQHLFVSSTVLSRDFCASLKKLRQDMEKNPTLVDTWGVRLKWVEDDMRAEWEGYATRPPQVQFICQK